MIVSKIGRRGQITLPRSIRNWLKLQEGDQIAFVRRGDDIVVQPLTQTLLDLRGSMLVSGPQDFDAIRQEVKIQRAKKVVQDEA